MKRVFIVLFFSFQILHAQEMDQASFSLVNSSLDEQSPVLSPDGNTLYFTVGNHPKNIGGKKDPGDIWISKRNGKGWTDPIHGGSIINDRAYNAVAGMSGNGRQLFLHGHYDPARGVAKTQGISVSNIEGNSWSRPVNISIPYYQNKSGMLNGTITSDNSIFVFSADTYGSYGVDDLYVSLNNDGKWSEPKNLGRTINTQSQELCPFISSDGKTLYFSSNGRKGKGSFDIYTCTRLDESWMSWTEPVNLGDDINTTGRDLYFRSYGDFAIFTSTINSDGYGDVKFNNVKEPEPKDSLENIIAPPDTVIAIASNRSDSLKSNSDVAPDTVVTEAVSDAVKVYGKVTNSKTGEVITAQIKFTSPSEKVETVSASPDGYEVSVPAVQNYNIEIEAAGYVGALEQLDVRTDEMKELEMNFKLQPVEIGTRVNLKNVLFAQTKDDILPESYPELDMVVNFLKANPTVRIELSGHTDNRGIHSDNVKLSHHRVNKVKDYLVEHGIDAKRIAGKGYGGTRPIASNATEESRRMNRRVEFTIKKF